jgi:integrase
MADKTAPRKYTIGKHGNLTPDQARARAKELAAMVEKGVDPRQAELDAIGAKDEAKRQAASKAKLESELVFEKVAERWLEHYEAEKGRRPRTVEQARHIVKMRLEPALKGKPLPHITRADLQGIIDAIPMKHRASRLAVYAYSSVLFRWAMERGEITDNPVRLMAKPSAPEPRNRVLTDDELLTIWKAAERLRDPYRAYFKLLILTGQRREEVAGMVWTELDRGSSTWTTPAKRTKNGVVQIVPLASAVVEELDRLALTRQVQVNENETSPERWPKSGPVLTTYGKTAIKSYSKAKAELDDAITKGCPEADPLPAWRVHDLRRTLATGLQRLGVRFEVTEAVLNHVSGARSGVAGIYQRHDWKDEKRAALAAWAAHVQRLISGATSNNVIELGARA